MYLKTQDPAEIFAEAIVYFKEAERQCTDDAGACVYRNAEGKACVAGHFIVAEDEYDDHWLRQFAGTFSAANQDLAIGADYLAERTLLALQNVHDQSSSWGPFDVSGTGPFDELGWERLREVGVLFGLDVSEIPCT